MATNLDNLRCEGQARPDDIAVEFAEIKRLLREIDDFVSNLKILEESLARHTDEDTNTGAVSDGCDSAAPEDTEFPLDAPERKKPLLI